jgi:hypothetical protein
MTESRIEITERLRREGRWSDACDYRDKARKRGRTEGLSRKEANDRAWSEMADEFPPMSEDEIAAYPSTDWVVSGHFPPSLPHLDADDEPRFADIHFAIHTAIAMLHAYLNQSALGQYRTVNGAMMYLIKCQAGDEARLDVAFAITDPVAFLVGPARKKLQAVEDRLTDAEHAGEQLDELKRKMIRSMLRSLNRMTTERVSEVVRTDFAIS